MKQNAKTYEIRRSYCLNCDSLRDAMRLLCLTIEKYKKYKKNHK